MWLKSIFTKSLRDYRVAIFGWGIGMGLICVATMASVSQLINTAEARAELVALSKQFEWNAPAIEVDTVGGYTTFKIGIFIYLVLVWPLLAGSRMLRGEEERGSLDVLLSTPRSRARVVLEKIGAYWAALLGMTLAMALVLFGGGERFGATFGFAGAFLFALDLALLCAVFAGIALFLSQFTQERGTAAGWTGALLLLFIVVDMVGRVFPGKADWLVQLSPISYYNLSKPLIPSFGTSVGGMLTLLGLALILDIASVWLFLRRDVGATIPLPSWFRPQRAATPGPAPLPTRDWSLRSVYLRGLRMIAMSTFWWTLFMAGFAAWMFVVVKQISAQIDTLLKSSPAFLTMLQQIGGSATDLTAQFISAIFQILPILLMAFVVSQVNAWSSDEEDGRLELVLATPQPRRAVILGRFAALSTATIVIGVTTLLVCAVAAIIGGVDLDGGKLAAACLGMIPLGILIGGIGYFAGGWLRTAADTGLLSVIVAAWFFITFIGPDLQWPDAAMRVSALYYYGKPLVDGIPIANIIGLLALAIVALALGTLRFARKDIGV